MFPSSVDRLLRKIASFKDRNDPYLTPQMEARIQILQMELEFLKAFIWCSQHEPLRKYGIGAAIRNGKRKLKLDGTSCSNSKFDRAVCAFLQEIELCKPKIRQDCFHLLDSRNWCTFSSTFELLPFLNSAVHNLRNLVRFKAKAIVSVRLQVKVLIKKLRLFRDFVDLTGKKLFFSLDIQDWACKITFITVLLWVEQVEEASIAQLKECLIVLLTKSYSAEFIGRYVRALKDSNSRKLGRLQKGKIIESFVYFILQTEYLSIIGAELMFLIACAMDPPWRATVFPWKTMDAKDEEEWNFIVAKAKQVAASEVPSLICSLTSPTVTDMNKSINVEERINDVLVDFIQKTHKVKAWFRKFYAEILESTKYLFYFTNVLRTMDSTLETLGNLIEALLSKVLIHNDISFAKDQFLTLHNELVSIIPFLKKIHELEEEPMDLRIRICEVAYQVGYVTDAIQAEDIPIWYSVMFLSDVIEDVKLIKREILMINHMKQRHAASRTRRVLNADSVDLDLSHTDDAIIGFHDEEEKIIDRLTEGEEKLDIFAIVGMPGQGKTTLAKKVYNSPLVRYRFKKFAWCFVTQTYQVKKLLMDLLRDINSMHVDEMHKKSEEDLAEKLYKCLKGQKYLIILDDIWDITAWNALKVSFPDDNNGSKILFTSRNKFWSESFLLQPLSEKESMELLKHKLLQKESSLQASNFYGDAQKILRICNGLPLAIVVVGSLLKRVSNNLNRWREVVQNLLSALPSEGCMDILELSYNSLPPGMKLCFLYLASVAKQTKVFKVEKVFQLWIAEGFVQQSGIKSLEAMANEYLEDLAGRNLVIVHKRSFTNGVIKECVLHDLFYELCVRKVEEEKIMYLPKHSPYSSKISIYGAICLRYYGEQWMADSWQEDAPKTATDGSYLHSLLFSADEYFSRDIFLILSMLKFVRVLDMWSVNLDHGFPEEIVDLICLKFLAISFYKPFIPLSICNLRNLESFHVSCYSTIDFPLTIWEMKALRNINFFGGGIEIVLNSSNAKLENLDTLSKLCIYDSKDAENLLRGFPTVRKLRLKFGSGWQCWDCGSFQVLKTLKKLECLKLEHSFGPAQTCPLNFPATLKKLSISYFRDPLNKLSHIGKLPNLEILKLWHHPFVKEKQRWEVGDAEFVNLKVLKLGGFKISHWEVPTSSFLRLDKLVLKSIEYLDELPLSFEDVMTLKVIQLQFCRKSLGTSAMSILSAQRDIGNEELRILISDEVKDYYSPSRSSNSGNSFLPKLSNEAEIFDKKRDVGLDKKVVAEKRPAAAVGFKKRHVVSTTRTDKLLFRHNFQARQAIMSRHYKEEHKRDG